MWWGLALVGAACGGGLPEPATVDHPPSDYVVVPYPPPAALVELVSPKPERGAKWVDGQWEWNGRQYQWERGGWLRIPPSVRLAPWDSWYLPDGTLLFAPSRWFDRSGRAVAAPPTLVPATTPPNEVTVESEAAR